MKEAEIILLKGDITERATDAIINTANNRLILGSGLGGAIKAKGGSAIAEECAKHGIADLGDAVLTSGGSLKTGAVIHAVLMEYDGQITRETIDRGLRNSLKLAQRQKFKSLAIPDLSVGITRFSPEISAETIFLILKEFLAKRGRSLKRVEVVLWDIDTFRIYKNKYAEVFEQEST
jgi:O-acetyl-ADP-ribose deacetylase (regulator of RNase III)